MTVGGIGGANASPQSMYGMGRQTDSYSRNIQSQIANAQKELQELSSNVDMTLEEKMKKRQEIQQEITNLNQQLRQHQMEQRKEQQSKGMSMDDMLGGSRNTAKAGNKGSGLSHAAMSAMISADSSMKQAKVQGGMAVRMEGSAGVLESEIKMDKSRGTDTKKKEEELANLQTRAEATTAAQISTLADAVKVMKEAERKTGQRRMLTAGMRRQTRQGRWQTEKGKQNMLQRKYLRKSPVGRLRSRHSIPRWISVYREGGGQI